MNKLYPLQSAAGDMNHFTHLQNLMWSRKSYEYFKFREPVNN